jgi:uncharacterized protein YoaH (UPF0181 family)
VAATVAEQVVERVETLMREGAARTRAQAIRRVAEEMDRSESATSSAYYSGRRAAAAGAGPVPAARRARPAGDHTRLYGEMLPLVEAGATIEQAARRFGDEDEADEIAGGFTRWLLTERERTTDGETAELAEARRRVAALEAEVRGLRRELLRLRRGLGRVRVIAADLLDDADG